MHKEIKKKKQEKLRNKKLIKEYPFLLPRNRWTGKVPKDYDYSYTEYPNNMGWFKLFGKDMIKEIRDDLVKNGFLYDYRIMDIKSKFGELRWYDFHTTEEIQKIIAKYSIISRNCCEVCGKPDVGITNGYWIMPICKKCYEKDKYNTVPYEEAVDIEDSKIQESFTWRDETIDISDTVNKLRNKWNKTHKGDENYD